ncbi:MAG: thioredoxin family protein [Acholeplasmataceae bacterium]
MTIRVLGKGCKNCRKLEETVRQAASELGLDYRIEKVTDVNEIADYGVLRTPALVIDERVVLEGRRASVSEIKKLLE